jgi:two-component system, cell cycle sensor histidine kinase and response regulator CckA
VQPVDLSRLVTGIVPLVKASFPRKVHLSLNLAPNLPAVDADKTQVEQVIMNLLINAAEAVGEEAGTIVVTTATGRFTTGQRQHYFTDAELRGDFAVLEVRDDGIGMDEETIARIFDPFFTTKFMGRGLGLSAVLGIVRSHKGAIRVSSTPGRGTTFELLFPISESVVAEVPAERSAARVASPDAGRRAVLVVDDEQIIRNFFRSALETHGFQVVTADNGAEALDAFSRDPGGFSLVLLDLVMPVMSGKDVLPRLLELCPDAKIVVTSGQVEEQVRRELSAWKIAGFIQKPCAVEPFLNRIRSVM